MSIDMYLSDSQAQGSSAWTMAESEMLAYAKIEAVLSEFEGSSGQLKGKAFDSARTYSAAVLRPLARGGRLLAEAIGTAVKRFPEAYVEQVAAESLKESELMADIAALDSQISQANQMIDTLTSGDAVDTKADRLASYQNIVSNATSARTALQEKLDKLRAFNGSSPAIFSEIATLKSLVDQGLAQLSSGWDAQQGVYILPADLSWAANLNRMNPQAPPVTKEQLDFYNSLPEDIRKAITINDIQSTDDGFFIITKPVSEILKSMGKTEVMIDGNPVPVDEIYDDHFIFGVKGDEGYSFSVLKMRELEDSQGNHGVSIPFISTDLHSLFEFSDDGKTIQSSDHFFNEFQRVVADKGQEADSTILEYFKDTGSKGSYLVADLYTDKVIKDSGSNTINSEPLDKILEKIEKIDQRRADPRTEQVLQFERRKLRRIPSYLEELNQKAGYEIYNPKTGDVTVKDPNNLTHYERQAILAVTTGNVNYNSFAAEVEFHADAVDDWKSSIPFAGSKWKESAIRADMGLGEENESGYADRYYILEDESVKRQKEAHGDQ